MNWACVLRALRADKSVERSALSAICRACGVFYADEDPNRPVKPNENGIPGLAPITAPDLDPVELVVDGEKFVVTRRTGSSGTYDFAWASQPATYGFTIGSNADLASRPSRTHRTDPQLPGRHRPADWLPARLIRMRIVKRISADQSSSAAGEVGCASLRHCTRSPRRSCHPECLEPNGERR